MPLLCEKPSAVTSSPTAVAKELDDGNLGKEGLTLAHNLKLQILMTTGI